MSAERYAAIITGLCSMYGIEPKHVIEGGTLEVNGVRIALRHNEEALSPLVMMYCDFGPVPSELEARVYRQLLQSNLSTYSGQGESFCLTAEGRVVLVNNYLLENLTAEILAGYLALASIYAKQWREDYFLPDGGGAARKTRANSFAGLRHSVQAGRSRA